MDGGRGIIGAKIKWVDWEAMKRAITIVVSVWVVLVGMGGLAWGQTTGPRPAVPPRGTRVAVIYVEGEINSYTQRDLQRRFARAKAAGVQAVVLDIDSYGGLVTAGLDMSRFLKQQKDFHVTAFVSRKAISAGAMIAVACDEIVMTPSSTLGDCAPIVMGPEGGLQSVDATNRAKMESPVIEDFRDSAQRNGYDTLLMESMVTVGREVYWVKNGEGQRRFVDGETYAQLSKEGWTAVLPDRNPIDSKKSLLTVNATLAQQIGIAKAAVVPDIDTFLADRGWQAVLRLERGPGDALIAFLSSGTVTFFLITIFSISIYVAMHAPGHGMAEVAMVSCLAVLLGVPLLTGYAEWWEVLCVLIGIILLALEIFVIPGFGITGVTGILLIIIGLMMTLVPPLPPEIPGFAPRVQLQWELVTRALLLVLGAMFTSLVAAFFISRHLPILPIGRKLVLTATVGRPLGGSGEVPPAGDSGGWIKVGDLGKTTTDLHPGGMAAFFDPILGDQRPVDVLGDGSFIPAGTAVIVHELRGQVIVVRRALA